MEAPERIPLSRLTANSLEKEILTKRWKTKLPGYRQLCKELQVSRKTLVGALKILTRRGILLPPNGTQARRINPILDTDKNRVSASPESRHVLIVVAEVSLEDLPNSDPMNRVYSHFQEKGWQCIRIKSNEAENQPGIRLREAHRTYPHARWLIHVPSTATANWCIKNNVRAVAFGGSTRGIRLLPSVSVSLSGMMIQSYTHLRSLGHERITCLADDNHVAQTVQKYSDFLQSHNVAFKRRYHLPQMENITPEEFNKTLASLFSITPPTAVFVFGIHILLGLLGFCIRRGIRVPGDLSILVSEDVPDSKYFSPELTHLARDGDREARNLTNYLQHYPHKTPKPLFTPMKLVEKGSILDLRKLSIK